jgi:phosphohistidine phosphatase SixA
MRRTFLRHTEYDHGKQIKVLNAEGLFQAREAADALREFATAPTTKLVVSDCDRTIEVALFLVLPHEEAWRRIQQLRETAKGFGDRRYVYLRPELPFELCANCVHLLPTKWSGYHGDLLFVGHEPAAEKLGLKLREGEFANF